MDSFKKNAGFEKSRTYNCPVIVNWLLLVVEGDYMVHILSKVYLNRVSRSA